MPHFNRESLEVELPKQSIEYVWLKELGGRRKKVLQDSPNTALRNESFRNYADYMMTEEFAGGIARLLEIAEETAGPLRLAPLAQGLGARRERLADLSTSTSRSPAPQTSGAEKSRERFAQNDKSNAGPSTRSPVATSLRMPPEEGAGGTAIMCAERVYFQCHRMLVSDYLTAHGHTVLHIDDEKRPVRQHRLMAEARLVDGKLVYDGGRLL